jgi:hypothetical protein
MSLVRGEVNPLNALDARRLNYIPIHFAKMSIVTFRITEIDQWIYLNLDSRYAIAKTLRVNPAINKLEEIQEIGIEDSKELTMLSLACPYLDKNK